MEGPLQINQLISSPKYETVYSALFFVYQQTLLYLQHHFLILLPWVAVLNTLRNLIPGALVVPSLLSTYQLDQWFSLTSTLHSSSPPTRSTYSLHLFGRSKLFLSAQVDMLYPGLLGNYNEFGERYITSNNLTQLWMKSLQFTNHFHLSFCLVQFTL